MSKKTQALTANEILDVKKLLRKGRNRYDNALLDIEGVWKTLKPHEYARRAKLIKAALGMLDIDKNLTVWERKINEN